MGGVKVEAKTADGVQFPVLNLSGHSRSQYGTVKGLVGVDD